MKVTTGAIVVELDDVKHNLTLEDAQRLYDLLGGVSGIKRHSGPNWLSPFIQPQRFADSGRITVNGA